MKIGDSFQTEHGLGRIVGTRVLRNGAAFLIVDIPYRPGYPLRVFVKKNAR